jgi:uncharacterized damage-inducible protein DinB
MSIDETHLATDERAALVAFLDRARGCVLRKVDGLSDDEARLPRTATGTSFGGLVKHLTWAERYWFEHNFLGNEITLPFDEEDPEADMRMEPGEALADLVADYRRAAEETRLVLTAHDLDSASARAVRRGHVSLRWIGWHMVEETARHAGHIDVLREQLDGTVGD